MGLYIRIETPDQPDVAELIAALDAYQLSLYPPESTHLLELEALKQPQVVFIVARDDDHRAVGCGAVVLQSDYGEVKRMYVHPRGRGKGVAKAMLSLLESSAASRDVQLLKLETGPLQPQAIGLYMKGGFEVCGPFGGYPNDPLSIFMEKRISR